MLRRTGLPDIPEVRRLLRACWLKGLTLGGVPGRQEMRAIREEAEAAARHAMTAPDPVALDRITAEPAKMGGQPCIRGHRVTAGHLLGLAAAGWC